MLESRERYLQYLAALRFYEEATGDFTFYQEEQSSFTEEELREEAAFRCWLREIHIYPTTLPPSATLRVMADAYDCRVVVVARLELVRRLPRRRSARDVRRLLVLRAILHHVQGLDRRVQQGHGSIA